MQLIGKNSDRNKPNACREACYLPVLLFPKAAIRNYSKAGLLTCSTSCGLPILSNSG